MGGDWELGRKGKPMKLKEAIELISEKANDCEAIEIILAAARAHACESCGGSGASYDWHCMRYVECEACKADRAKARGTNDQTTQQAASRE